MSTPLSTTNNNEQRDDESIRFKIQTLQRFTMTMMTTSGSIRRLYTILYIFLIFLTVSCKSCGSPQSDDDEKQQQQSSSIPSKDIQLHLELFQACQKGPASKVKEILTHHPDWIPSRIASGETCLHTASITGQVDVIELLVGNFKMNPNVQTKGHGALRDTPLSMNVKNGNVQAAKVLLENGADVHLDFDSEYSVQYI
jgi:ankyrin repeat protein